MNIREGSAADTATVLALFDEAVAWLVARGQEGQWGSEPWSASPRGVARVRGLLEADEAWIAESAGEPVGALTVGAAPEYVDAAGEPELYVTALVTSRRHAGREIGARLVEHALDLAAERRAGLLRVDCWADAPGLVGWYERRGFARTSTFSVRGWRGQVLARRLDRAG